MNESSESVSETRPRWRMLLVVQVVLFLLWFILKKVPRFEQAGAGGAIDLAWLVFAIGLGLLWLLFFSRLAWKWRLLGLGVAAASLAMIKIDGHTGSFFPQFSWRWSKESADELPELTGKMASEGSVIETRGSENFPRFLGATMTNWVSDEGLPENWFAKEPEELWRKKIGEGWSSFSVAGGFAFTMEQRGAAETTICYELATGEAVWVHEESVRFEESMGDDGPRSTPTVVDGKVFSMGATGILNCLDARTGKRHWGKDLLAEVEQRIPKWAKSCSPLVVDGKVVVTLGKEAEKNLAALDVTTGEIVWRSGDYSSSYASPVVAELAGRLQIVALQQKSVDGYDVASGEILWSFPIGNSQGNCASPMIVGDSVITSSGYGYGTHRIAISREADGFVAKELWHSRKLKAKFADVVISDGFIYGLNDGRLVCLNVEDGKLKWRGSNYGHGQILGVGKHLVIQGERGELNFLAMSSEDEEVITSFEVMDQRTWNHPVLAGRILLVRNDREAVALKF